MLHFTNAPIDVDTVLSLANLSRCKLEDTTLSFFVCNLLASYGESTLGLNGRLLYLHQDLLMVRNTLPLSLG